jgi:type IV pilus assembly protein PilN
VRLNINLATKPYQDVRRILTHWGGLVLLLAICTVALVSTAVSSWRESREVNAKIAGLETEIAALDRQRTEAIAVLHRPQNSTVVDTSKFLNGLIVRKTFSWTRVFMQLEEIMPPGLHVVSISPDLEPKTSTVEVHLTVAGTSRDAAVELVKRLEKSPAFREARIVEESQEKDSENQGRSVGNMVKFHLSAIYVPRPIAAAQQQTAAATPATAAPAAKAARSGGGIQ